VFHVKQHKSASPKIAGPEYLRSSIELFKNNKEQLQEYIDLLLWWNQKINLVSRNVSRETLREHVIHSLLPAAMGLLNSSDCIVDAGTGGGLPGIPLSIIYPEKRFILNDIVAKKTMAVKQIARDLNLSNAEVQSCSVEKIDPKCPFLIVTKHAFEIASLYRMVKNKQVKEIVFYKGCSDAISEINKVKHLSSDLHSFQFGEKYKFYADKCIAVVKC